MDIYIYGIYWYLITSHDKLKTQLALGIQASRDGRLGSLVSPFSAPCSLCQAAQADQAAQVRQAPCPAPATVLPRRLQRVHQVDLRFLVSNNLRKKYQNQKCIENSKAKRWYVGVSKNSFFSPKSSILIGFSINHPFWGPTPIFGNTRVPTNLPNIFGDDLVVSSRIFPQNFCCPGWSLQRLGAFALKVRGLR